MKNTTQIRFITEVAVFSAIALVLDFIAGWYSNFIWPLGGSISIAMVPIFIMSFRWGLKGGLLTGLVVGSLQILWANPAEAPHPLQIILDYPLAYTLVGFSGLYAKKIANSENAAKLYYITIAIIVGGVLRYIPHVISGYVFFRHNLLEDLPNYIPVISFILVYNLGYLVPSIFLSIIVIRLIVRKRVDLIEM